MVKTRSGTASSKEDNETELSARQLRQQERHLRRSKNTGKIHLDEAPVNQKIVFDDEDGVDRLDVTEEVDPSTEMEETTMEEKKAAKNVDTKDNDDDDDDDAVEEVKGTIAKEQMQTQRSQERSSSNAILPNKKKKRKNLQLPTQQAQLDDNFFEALEREQQESKRNQAKHHKQQNTHTTFVVQGHMNTHYQSTQPQSVDHNIQLVVLPHKDSRSTFATHAQPWMDDDDDPLVHSRQALLFADGRAGDNHGSGTTGSHVHSSKKQKRKPPRPWKRTHKAIPTSKQHRGQAALQFVRTARASSKH